MINKFTLACFIAALLVTSRLQGAAAINWYFSSQPNHYYGDPSPQFNIGSGHLDFTSAVIASGDGLLRMSASGYMGWPSDNPHPVFTTKDALIDHLSQPWTLLLDEGLPTERNFTMSFNVGELASMDITPPTIIYPTHLETLDNRSPTLQFGIDPNYSYRLALQRFEGTTGKFVTSIDLPLGTSSWTPASPLLPGKYALGLSRQVAFTDTGFSAPVDELGIPIDDWESYSFGMIESNISFTIVPEPMSGLLFCAVLPVPLRFRMRVLQDR